MAILWVMACKQALADAAQMVAQMRLMRQTSHAIMALNSCLKMRDGNLSCQTTV